jgi:hypothetical protein
MPTSETHREAVYDEQSVHPPKPNLAVEEVDRFQPTHPKLHTRVYRFLPSERTEITLIPPFSRPLRKTGVCAAPRPIGSRQISESRKWEGLLLRTKSHAAIDLPFANQDVSGVLDYRSVIYLIGLLVFLGALLPTEASATSSFADISCVSTTNCMAVGSSDTLGTSQTQAASWDGLSWLTRTTPVPSGADLSDLSGVACASATACVAVGSYSDVSQVEHALAMSWNGTSWSIVSLPAPTGAKSSRLSDISCTSATACLAAGSYEDSSNATRTLIMKLNEGSWSVVTSPNVEGAGSDALESISCSSSSACFAVGNYASSSGLTVALALQYNGTTWSLSSVPAPTGATYSSLSAVSCLSGNCKAVGTYFTSTGVQKSLISQWSGSAWATMTVAEPAGTVTSKLQGISCTTTTVCAAVGTYDNGSDDLPMALWWNGTSWKPQTVDISSVGALSSDLAAVSCLSSTFCHGVGSIVYGHASAERNLGFKFDGTGWAVTEAGGYERAWSETSPRQSAPLEQVGVSCVSSSFCIRVGTYQRGQGVERPFAQRSVGSSWSAIYLPTPSGAQSSALEGVSCRSTTDCIAVGRFVDESSVERPFSLSYNGSTWSVLTTPVPAGATAATLSSVSCATGFCMAVGHYVDSEEVTRGLSMIWKGTLWALAAIPTPAGATGTLVNDVSCTSASFCKAVGHFNEGEALRALALNWGGSLWSLASLPAEPTGTQSSSLAGVSCFGITFCSTVGGYWDSSGNLHGFAERFSGGAWTRAVPPSPTGNRWSALSDVYCGSASACVAVGKYAEEDGDQQALATSLEGTEWSLTALTAPEHNLKSSLDAVTCVAEGGCTAAGTFEDTANVGRVLSMRWTGSVWSAGPSPEPAGASSAELLDAACVNSVSCVAVGKSTVSGVVKNLAVTGKPQSWSLMTTPTPAGSSASELLDVRCLSATDCTAVGAMTVSGVRKPLAMKWNGTSWSVTSVPVPVGATADELTSVFCVSASFCAAVGDYTASGVKKNLAMSWNGTAWSIVTTPTPPSATASKFEAISCTSTSFCTAVGEFTEAGTTKNLAMKWNGTSWAVVTVPNLGEGGANALGGVACTSSTWCMAVGYYTYGYKQTSAMVWNGTTWSSTGPPSAEPADRLRDVTCVSSTSCLAVGFSSEVFSEAPVSESILSWNGTGWSQASGGGLASAEVTSLQGIACGAMGSSFSPCVAVGRLIDGQVRTLTMAWGAENGAKTSFSGLYGISCLRESCMAVGRLESELVDRSEVAWQFSDSGWRALSMPNLRQGSLLDVSCSSTSACTAVGDQYTGALVERWDGSKWAVQSPANPTGTAISLAGVSCPSTSNCTAVGRYFIGSQSQLLVESWNGTSWSIQSAPLPSGATAGWLEDVSCTSTSSCVAVGAYKDAGAVVHGLTEGWNGTTWTAASLGDPPSSTGTELTAVSCRSSTSCKAVGNYSVSSSRYTLASSWNGTVWSNQSTPNQATAAESYLNDVHCYASARCVAVGQTRPPNGSNPSTLTLGWNGSDWTLESTPNRETSAGYPYDQLNAVSCSAGGDCISVGFGQDNNSRSELALGTPDTTATPPNVKEDEEETVTMPALTETQTVQAQELIEANPTFQSIVQGDNFAIEVGPWSETNNAEEAYVIGAMATVAMVTPHDWDQRTWPTVFYEDNDPDYYLFGTYSTDVLTAETEEVTTVKVGLDAEIDASGNFTSGEVVKAEPVPDVTGEVILAPEEEGEEDPNAWER